MMTHAMKKGALKTLLATAAALPFAAIAQALDKNDIVVEEPTIANGTLVLSSERPHADTAGNVSFTLKVNEMSFGEKLRLLSAKRTALIFDGADEKANRLCPFFNLETRDYKIKEVELNVYRVTTTVSPAEAARVRTSGCAVTTAPDRKKIEFL